MAIQTSPIYQLHLERTSMNLGTQMHALLQALGPEHVQTVTLMPCFPSTTALWNNLTPDQIVLPYPYFKRNV